MALFAPTGKHYIMLMLFAAGFLIGISFKVVWPWKIACLIIPIIIIGKTWKRFEIK